MYDQRSSPALTTDTVHFPRTHPLVGEVVLSHAHAVQPRLRTYGAETVPVRGGSSETSVLTRVRGSMVLHERLSKGRRILYQRTPLALMALLVACSPTVSPGTADEVDSETLSTSNPYLLQSYDVLLNRVVVQNGRGVVLPSGSPIDGNYELLDAGVDWARMRLTFPAGSNAFVRTRVGLPVTAGRLWTFSTKYTADASAPREVEAVVRRVTRDANNAILQDDVLVTKTIRRGDRGYLSATMGRPVPNAKTQVVYVQLTALEADGTQSIRLDGPSYASKEDPTADGSIVNYIDMSTLEALNPEQDEQLRELSDAGHRVWVLGIRSAADLQGAMAIISAHPTLQNHRFIVGVGGLTNVDVCDIAYYEDRDGATFDADPVAVSTAQQPLAAPPANAPIIVRQNCAELTTSALACDPRSQTLASRLDLMVEAVLSYPNTFKGVYMPDELASAGLPVEYQHALRQYLLRRIPNTLVFGTHSFYIGSGGNTADRFGPEIIDRYYSASTADYWFFDYYTANSLAGGNFTPQQRLIDVVEPRWFLAKPFIKLFYAASSDAWACADSATFRTLLCNSAAIASLVAPEYRANWASNGFWAFFDAEARTTPPRWTSTLAKQESGWCAEQYAEVVKFSRARSSPGAPAYSCP